MRRAPVIALTLATLAAGLAVSTEVLGSPPSATPVIDFENVPTGPIYYVYSQDGHGPFAIDGYNWWGLGQAIVVNASSGKGRLLSVVKPGDCGCMRLDIDLSACEAGAVALESFRLVGTTRDARVVYLDRGGNSWPSVDGQIVPATGLSGSVVVKPNGAFGAGVSKMFVYLEHNGAVDDIRFTCPDAPFPPPPPPTSACDDWFTGGGFLFDTPSGAKANYGVGGGFKNGDFWGHLNYIDHGTGMHVKGVAVTAYSVTGAVSRHVEGTCTISGLPGTYSLDIADNGEPGFNDTLTLKLSTVLLPNFYVASGVVDGGNLQLHKANCSTGKGKAKSAKKKNKKRG